MKKSSIRVERLKCKQLWKSIVSMSIKKHAKYLIFRQKRNDFYILSTLKSFSKIHIAMDSCFETV